jgi:hypothetical protein
MRRAFALLALCGLATTAFADPDPKRKVAVLEYRSGSAALPGIAKRLVTMLGTQTSLGLVGPEQARLAYGTQLESQIVSCAGEAVCIAAIGQKVGAAEVVLVGVSELGDVILTMQRIDVAAGTVSARIADSLAEGEPPTDEQVAAYLQRLFPQTDFKRFGVIDIVANITDAVVTVGGERRGTTPIEPLTLPAPATYEVRIEKDGFLPYATRIALPPDGTIKVEAELAQRGQAAWYQHWYVIAGLGVLLVGAGATTIYFATRDSGGNGELGVMGEVR